MELGVVTLPPHRGACLRTKPILGQGITKRWICQHDLNAWTQLGVDVLMLEEFAVCEAIYSSLPHIFSPKTGFSHLQ